MLRMSFAIAVLGASLSVQAAEEKQFYFGASVGQARMDAELSGLPDFSGNATAFKVFLGHQIHRNFAMEYTYIDGSHLDDTISGADVSVDGRGFDLAFLGILPLGSSFQGFAKVGALYWDAEATASFGNLSATIADNSTELSWGVGGMLDINPRLTMRLQYDGADADGADLHLLTLGASWAFD